MTINKDERVEMARSFFKQGFNCAQSVALAYSDIIAEGAGLSEEEARRTALTVTSALGGGIARMREVCGCVSAMAIVAGAVHPSLDPGDHSGRTASYALTQELAGKFREINGSIVCRELLGLAPNAQTENPAPSLRTPEYYKKRPCGELVAIAAGILADALSTF